MIRSIALFILALVVLSFSPRVARSQSDPHSVSFGIGGGTSLPVRDAQAAYMPGFSGNAFLSIDLGTLPLALRADVTYQNFELRHAAIPAAGLPGGGSGMLLGGTGDLQLYLRRGGVRPYVLAGLGAYSVRSEYDSQALETRSETRLGGHGGVGLQIAFGSLNVYAEGTLDHVPQRSGTGPVSTIQVVPLTLGILF